jgi:major type 1 subunit fimbrin (pilin)
MKKGLLITAFAAATGLAMLAPAANAADGTITFNGSITGQTCTVASSGGGSTFTVTLPKVSTSSLATAGSYAGRTLFTINLSACSPATGGAYVNFELGPNTDTATGGLRNAATGGATNVEVFLLDSTFAQVKVGTPVATPTYTPITAGAATLTYYAEYMAVNGAATAGAVTTNVDYSIVYQ